MTYATIKISKTALADLAKIATWLGTDTPPKTIERLIQEKMAALGLECDEGKEVVESEDDVTVFERAPDLAHTKIHSATIDGNSYHKSDWKGLLIEMAKQVKIKNGFTAEQLTTELKIPTKPKFYEENGYCFYPELGISIPSQSAPDAWEEVSRLAKKHQIPVEVQFQWLDKEKAKCPGRVGIIRAGS